MSPRKQLSVSETERCEIKLENDLISVTRTLRNDEQSGQSKRRGSNGSVDEQVAETKTLIKSRKPVRKKSVEGHLSKPSKLDDKAETKKSKPRNQKGHAQAPCLYIFFPEPS